jgi:hypothetical protein
MSSASRSTAPIPAGSNIERLLALFGLSRAELTDANATAAAVRKLAARVPTYVTLKDVKKRWGHGQRTFTRSHNSRSCGAT